jgi:hypothetical protein
MKHKPWQEAMHEALDAGRPAAGASQVAAHLAEHPEDRALVGAYERLEAALRSRRAALGTTDPQAVRRVEAAVRRHRRRRWARRALLGAAAALLILAALPLLPRGQSPPKPKQQQDPFAPTFVAWVDPQAEDPLSEAEFVLAIINEKRPEPNGPPAFGQILVHSNGHEEHLCFTNGRRVAPEVLLAEVVEGRARLRDPRSLYDRVGREPPASP